MFRANSLTDLVQIILVLVTEPREGRMLLLLRRVVLRPFLLKLLTVVITALCRLHVIVSNRLVTLALHFSIFCLDLLQALVDLPLLPLRTPRCDIVLIAHVSS